MVSSDGGALLSRTLPSLRVYLVMAAAAKALAGLTIGLDPTSVRPQRGKNPERAVRTERVGL